MFWFSGHKACGILAPQPEIKLTPPILEGEIFFIFYFLEGEILTIGPPGKSHDAKTFKIC